MKRNNNNPNLLNVHSIVPVSFSMGPGARYVVWVQGCSRHCPDCINPLTYSHAPRTLIAPRRLANSILAVPEIEGLTVTGGEPFEQPAAVGNLCRMAKEKGLSIMIFTGWTYESICLSDNPDVKSLLEQVDIIIDGPFIPEQIDNRLLWRGSSNQQIYFLTDRYRPEVLNNNQPRLEGRLATGSPLQLAGFWNKSDMTVLADRLATDAGIVLEPAEVDKKNVE
ncbi:MAG: radical SAM protein [Desulfobacteraceae bacterium]|nr:radical SAM protein [Desulfobacteraceae bacterium]